jgi:putative ABC transport system permease protein
VFVTRTARDANQPDYGTKGIVRNSKAPGPMRDLLQSLRYTIRLLLKSPGFSITAILILGFGIGANTAIFSLINTVVLKPLPYPYPERLVAIFMPTQDNDFMGLDYPDFLDISASQRSFQNLAVSSGDFLDLTGKGEPERLKVVFASPSLFKVTGHPFILGRPFTEIEDRHGGPLITVLSERFWRSHFNGDPKIIGTYLTLSEQSFQIVGVAPAQAEDSGPPPTDLYVPAHVQEVFGESVQKRDLHVFLCLGRLKDGVSLKQANADLQVIQDNLIARYPETNRGVGIRVAPFLDSLVSNYSGTIWLLAAAVGCLLLISSANVANLLFARALERRREMTIRAALGASRYRLVGQLLLETLFLSLLGGLVGIVFARCAIDAIKTVSPQDLYRFQDVGLDATVLFFVFGLTLLVALLSGLLPALNLSRADIEFALKEEAGRAGTVGPRRQRIQAALIVGQVTLACVLLIEAGLLVRSFEAALKVPLGFNPGNVLTAEIYPTATKYVSDLPRMSAFFEAVLEKVRSLPGVTDAAMNRDLPFNWDYGEFDPFVVVGQPAPEPGREPVLDGQEVSSDYFRTLQIPLLSGRDFDSRDTMDQPSVVIVDQALAQRFFPGQDAIGKRIEVRSAWNGKKVSTIVGVARNVLHNSPDRQQAPFQAYFPHSQRYVGFEILLVRTEGDPLALIPAVRKAVASVDADIPVFHFNTFQSRIAEKFSTRRLALLLVSVCAGVSLLLSGVGLYGVLAYFVSQRTRDIGIRIALGAQASNILRTVIRHGLKLVSIGLLVGIALALICARFINSMLYGVTANDPVSFIIATLVLCLAALLACSLPALRAIRINPVKALRE